MIGNWPGFIGLACICHLALAQVPDTGRWQELSFPSEEVHVQAQDRYQEILAGLAAKGQLDDDRELLKRVRHISATLIRAARDIKPETARWDWEIHTTSSPDLETYCMAGGKIMVSSVFIRQLDLRDSELAVLLGHEAAHAVAEHHREELSEALHFSPQPDMPLDVIAARLDSDLSLQIRLGTLSSLQESEADHLGMLLAHRAGWSTTGMVRFYEKLQATDAASTMGGSHPSMSSRLSMAKGMAKLLGDQAIALSGTY